MTIGERIKQRRKELDMTVEELAKRLGKNRATVYRYENGEIENLPTPILEPIAKALSTTPAYLLGWEENLDTETDFIAELFKDKKSVEYVKKLLSLSQRGKDAVYEMIDFQSSKERGLQ